MKMEKKIIENRTSAKDRAENACGCSTNDKIEFSLVHLCKTKQKKPILNTKPIILKTKSIICSQNVARLELRNIVAMSLYCRQPRWAPENSSFWMQNSSF